MSKREVIIGARGSALSMKQALGVLDLLSRAWPDHKFVFKKIITTGDRIKRELSTSEIGVFVKELEEALIEGKVDIAVHSLKDLPCIIPEGLALAAVTERLAPNDVFLSRNGLSFSRMPANSVIGTSSARRRSQILSIRKDLALAGMRGNIDTRLKKLRQGEVDGIICASCALERLDKKESISGILDLKDFLPAPGQAALGLEVREGDKEIREIVNSADHPLTAACVKIERDFLRYLGGGCHLPLGALAALEEKTIHASGYVGALDGSRAVKVKAEALPEDSSDLGRKLADMAIAEGAEEILRDIK